MRFVPLNSVAEVNPPGPRPAELNANTLVDFVPMASVSETGSMKVGEQRQFSEVAKGFTSFRHDDVLLAKITPCFENNKIAVAKVQSPCAFGSTEFHVLRCSRDALEPLYLLHFLRQDRIRHAGERRMTGSAGQRRVPKQFLEALQIPLPSLSEQRRIAAILGQADELRQKRQQALVQLARLPQAIFTEMFYGAEQPPLAAIDDVCSLVTDGTHYTPTYAENGVIFLSAKNVTSGYIDWKEIKYIPETLHADLQKRVSPRLGDILLAKNGTTGVSAIVDRDVVFDIYVSLALLRPGEGVLSTYLHQAVSSLQCRRQFTGALKGIGVSNLHLVDIRRTQIPLPSLSLQKKFSVRIGAVEKARAAEIQHLSKLDALFASLQHRAFNGELTAKAAERELAEAV